MKKKESAFGIIMLILVILTIFQYWKIICAVLIIFCLCLFLWVILKRKRENSDISLNIQFDNTLHPSAEIRSKNKIKKYSLPVEYVELSTSGDENVCPMCAQFEGKIFPAKRAPKLPLCPGCACAYLYYSNKNDLPSAAIISDLNNFTLPSEYAPMFYDIQQKVYKETNVKKQISICENQIEKLYEFMKPYISAKFSAPEDLACRDLLPKLYMQLGKWEKAEQTITTCINAGAYYPQNGSDALSYFKTYQEVALQTLDYITQNPGCLQRNIYKKMGYEGEEKNILKEFLRCSKLIEKVKYKNTNQLFCNTEELV